MARATSTDNLVGTTLRRFRDQAGVSTRELGRRLGVAASYISKIELGQLAPTRGFCKRAARALDLVADDLRVLVSLQTLEGSEFHPVPPGTGRLGTAQRAVRDLERSARLIRVYQPAIIPGLLQTREYAQAILRRFSGRSGAAVRERLARQTILEDRKRTFRFLLTEWSFAPLWCTKRVMERQLMRLKRVARWPNVEIRILVPEARIPRDLPPLVTGFEVLDETVAVVDLLTGFVTIRRPSDLTVYSNVYDDAFRLGRPVLNHDHQSF